MRELLEKELTDAQTRQQEAIRQLQEMDRIRPSLVAIVQITEGSIATTRRLMEALDGHRHDNLQQNPENASGEGLRQETEELPTE